LSWPKAVAPSDQFAENASHPAGDQSCPRGNARGPRLDKAFPFGYVASRIHFLSGSAKKRRSFCLARRSSRSPPTSA
jgi:hypothetical protein